MDLAILISYFFFRNADMDEVITTYFSEPYPRFFLDSGAWSAWTSGVTIDVAEYCKFIARYKHWFAVYANLDDMTCPETTWANQMRMEDMGFSPLPVFHTGEPFRYLERYVEQYPYVALGKIIPYTGAPKTIIPWLVECFRTAGDKTVFHGLGATNWTLLKSFPWYSVDSSSWSAGFRFGRVPLFDAARGEWTGASLGDRRSCYQNAAIIRTMGFDPRDFAERALNTRQKSGEIAARSYLLAQQWIREFHGPVRIPRLHKAIDPAAGSEAGLHLHMACNKGAALSTVAAANAGLHLHMACVTSDDFSIMQNAAQEGTQIQ